MAFAYNDAAASYHLPRRNARSFDLDDSATKAAAWVWHLHASKPGITTEARFISPQTRRRRSSGSYDRKVSRFQQEATTTMAKETVQASKADGGPQPVWDCGSNLYDTFELVAFSNSLDRSLMEAAPITPPQAQPQELHTGNSSSPNEPANRIPRAMSLPRRLSNSWRRSKASATVSSRIDMDKLKPATTCNNGTGAASLGPEKKAPTKGNTVFNFVSAMKKAAVLRTQAIDVGCKRSTNVIEPSQIRPIIRNVKVSSERKIEPESALNPKVIARLSDANRSDTEGLVDKLPADSRSFRYDYVCDSRSNYKLSIPMSNDDNYVRNGSNRAAMPRRVRAVSTDILNGGYVPVNHKTRSKSESFTGERNQKIRSARLRKHAENGGNGIIGDESKQLNDFAYVQNGDEGDSAGPNYGIRGSIEGDTEHEQLDLHKHLHHHHHHHHHHHYVHHNLTLEAARLHKKAMTHARVEQKLVNLAL